MIPIATDHAFEIVTHGPKHTFLIGERLGRLLDAGDVVCLQGDLGSGKTCLTQGIAAGLGISGAVTSPTFVLVNEYRSPERGLRLYHVDLYRIDDPDAALGVGLDDYLYGDGVTVIEWAERVPGLIPPDRLWVTLSYMGPTKRSLLFQAAGARNGDVLDAFRADLVAGRAHRLAQEDVQE